MEKRSKLTTNNWVNIAHILVVLCMLVWMLASMYQYGFKLDFNTKLVLVILVVIPIMSKIIAFLDGFLCLKKKKKKERKTETKFIVETVLAIQGILGMEKNYEEIIAKFRNVHIRGDMLKLLMIMSTGYRINNITIGKGVNRYTMYLTLETLANVYIMDYIEVPINTYDLINFLNYNER